MAESPKDHEAGESLREFQLVYQGRRILAGLLGLVLLLAIFAIGAHYSQPVQRLAPKTVLLVLLICFSVMVAVSKGITILMDRFFGMEVRYDRGAVGEERVGDILSRVSTPNHVVIHDVRTRHGNIDHVVLRRDGAIFLLETKAHIGNVTERKGQLLINRKPFERDILKQTLDNIFDLRSLLATQLGHAPWITAAIVFTNAEVPRFCKLHNVSVINARFLERWMSRARGDRTISDALWKKVGDLKALLAEEKDVHSGDH